VVCAQEWDRGALLWEYAAPGLLLAVCPADRDWADQRCVPQSSGSACRRCATAATRRVVTGMKSHLLSVAAVVLSMGCATIQPAAPANNTIDGRIFAEGDSIGLEGVTVEIVGTQISASTGRDGSFLIGQPLPGLRALKLSRDGYHGLVTPPLNLESAEPIRLHAVLQNTSSWTEPPVPSYTWICRSAGPCDRAVQESVPQSLVIDGSLIRDYPDLEGVSPATAELITRPIAEIQLVTGARSVKEYGSRGRLGTVVIHTRK
jgi:hypothetical protein